MTLQTQGKTKRIYQPNAAGHSIMEFTDMVSAYNRAWDICEGMGAINCSFSSWMMQQLNSAGIITHFQERLNQTQQLITYTQPIRLEVVCRNIATGSYLERHKECKKGDILSKPAIEYFFKDDANDDPFLQAELAEKHLPKGISLDDLAAITYKVNDIYKRNLENYGYKLWDFKCEFGVIGNENQLVIIDELTPDGSRITCAQGFSYDKDILRKCKPEEIVDRLATMQASYIKLLNTLEIG